jgi:hypothetical protein
VQSPTPSWGLDRIDAYKGYDNKYNYAYTGTGVHVYVLDGPMTNQAEFENRWGGCYSYTTEACSVAAIDFHASHVAGKYELATTHML